MAIVSISDLKAKFEAGDYPKQSDYEDLIDTLNASAFGGSLDNYIEIVEKGQPNGVAELDANGYVPANQLDIDFAPYYTSTQTDAAISTAIANLVDTAPATLDTLNELAAALGDDPNFATTVTNSIATKADATHTHTKSDITDFTHTHTVADVTDVTATAAELNVLDGITATTAELNYTDGVTSNIQTQLDGKAASSHTHTKSDITDLNVAESEVDAANNTYLGAGVPITITSGSKNTAAGVNSLVSLTSGYNNVSYGDNALQNLTYGNSNTAIGSSALSRTIYGADNVAVGRYALGDNYYGSYNVGVGRSALGQCLSSNNVGVGYSALAALSSGQNNVAVGSQALLSNSGGNNSIAIGSLALRDSYNSNNTAIGHWALRSATSGSNNTVIGHQAAYWNGSGNTTRTTTGSNNIIIGYNATASGSGVNNEITLGNSSITSLRCNVTSISSLSDIRDKTNIIKIPYGLDFVKKLNPVNFEWSQRDGARVGIKSSGFIAQELMELEDEYDAHENLNLTLRNNPEKYEASPGNLIPVLTKAIQELTEKVESLEARLAELEA